MDESENLTLEAVRHSLIRQEDSIIFSLLERAQYCYNADTYDSDAFSMDGFHGSLVEYMLRETEKLHAQVCYTQKSGGKVIIKVEKERKEVQKNQCWFSDKPLIAH